MSLQPQNFKPVSFDDKEGRLHARSLIENFQKAIEVEAGNPRGEADKVDEDGLEEYLIGGAYTRVITAPHGFCFVSELWRKERLWILLKGTLHVQSELGRSTFSAPYIGPAPHGTKIIGLCEGEVKFAAITGVTETTEVEEVEKFCIAKGYEEISYPWDMLEKKQ